jgi:hypothetical protein
MALQKQSFSAFTPALWEAFVEKVKGDTGVEITEGSGTVDHGAFVFGYEYNAAAQVLSVQCLKKPLFIPASTIINGLTEEIAQLKPKVQAQVNAPVPS